MISNVTKSIKLCGVVQWHVVVEINRGVEPAFDPGKGIEGETHIDDCNFGCHFEGLV